MRTFEEWSKSLPDELREKFYQYSPKNPPLNQVNYIWVTNMINNFEEDLNPTGEELLEWIKDGQIDAMRK